MIVTLVILRDKVWERFLENWGSKTQVRNNVPEPTSTLYPLHQPWVQEPDSHGCITHHSPPDGGVVPIMSEGCQQGAMFIARTRFPSVCYPHSPPDGAVVPIMSEGCQSGPSSQSYGFSSSHVWMWELDYKESWAPKNWCFWTVVLEKTLESPLDTKEIQPVHPKGDQSWIFIERTDAEAETPILWPPDTKNWLFGKVPDAGKDRRQEEKGTTKDEIVGWHHWLDGHEFKQAPGNKRSE